MILSVIVPLYNGRNTILRCADSILPQLTDEMELILVDDGSVDDGFSLIRERYGGDERVLLIRNMENHGPARARNAGIRLSRGEFIAFCDADDEWEPGRVCRMLEYYAGHPETEILYTGCRTVAEGSSERVFNLAKSARNDLIHLRAAMVRRDVFGQLGLLDETLRIREDTEWIVRARCGHIREAFLPETLYVRHIRDDGLSAGAGEEDRKDRVVRAFMRGIRRHRDGKTADNEETIREDGPLPGRELLYDLSILIPVYRAGEYIREAMESCVSGRYSHEIILVDDGSDDGSLGEMLRAAKEASCPVTIVSRCHKGQASSRNDALKLARGRCILYLDADDRFLPGAADILMDAAIEHPDAMLVSALCRDFISPELTEQEAKGLAISPAPYRRMLAGCMLARRELYDRIGLYDETMKTSETAQWVMRLRDEKIPVAEIEDVVLSRRYHRRNLGRVNRKAQMESYMAMIRKRLGKA